VGFRPRKSKAPAGAAENFFRAFRGFGHPVIFPTAFAAGYFLPRLQRLKILRWQGLISPGSCILPAMSREIERIRS